jgi:glutathione S-transferase
MTYQLFYADRSAAQGVRMILEELNQHYELIETDIKSEEPRSPELLAANPNGLVPVLAFEEGMIYECGAIVTFLCDRHPEYRLAPETRDPYRGLFLQWLFYFSSSLQNAFSMTYRPNRFSTLESGYSGVRQQGRKRLLALWQIVDNAIGESSWMLGESFSAVDIYLFMLSTWLSDEYGHPDLTLFTNVSRVADQVRKRPSVARVYPAFHRAN